LGETIPKCGSFNLRSHSRNCKAPLGPLQVLSVKTPLTPVQPGFPAPGAGPWRTSSAAPFCPTRRRATVVQRTASGRPGRRERVILHEGFSESPQPTSREMTIFRRLSVNLSGGAWARPPLPGQAASGNRNRVRRSCRATGRPPGGLGYSALRRRAAFSDASRKRFTEKRFWEGSLHAAPPHREIPPS
jgi:hypothetical protein